MHELLTDLQNWTKTNQPITVARVIQTWGSSPRPTGSTMLINTEGKLSGSVSGGCVEAAVVKAANALSEQENSKHLKFGVSDEEAWSVGLSCGGSLQVFIQKADFINDPVWSTLKENVENNKSSILITSLEDGLSSNSLITEQQEVIGDQISEELLSQAREAYDQRSHRTVESNDKDYFIQIYPRKSLLLVIGAAHITVDLVALGNMFGFETVVIDPRGYFANNISFTSPPSQILEAYPSEVLDQFPLDAYTFCAILSHDPKIDDNALDILLPAKVGYIGALGSRKTHAKRIARLLEKGVSQEMIDQIHAPIGLPIHARSAREIALSIMSQIIEVKNGGS
ncbi:MAG: XdhC family protein [Cyclobacteriaceae bacterium]